MATDTSSVTLNMLLTGTSTSRSWQILITQIPCGTTYTAPSNCLQWYTSATGTLTSYDYQFTSATTYPIQKLANQDYTICIRTNQVNRKFSNFKIVVQVNRKFSNFKIVDYFKISSF
jgi:hypothetical protein